MTPHIGITRKQSADYPLIYCQSLCRQTEPPLHRIADQTENTWLALTVSRLHSSDLTLPLRQLKQRLKMAGASGCRLVARVLQASFGRNFATTLNPLNKRFNKHQVERGCGKMHHHPLNLPDIAGVVRLKYAKCSVDLMPIPLNIP